MPALRKRGPMHEINVVPYIDVMLVLLIIFMVTAPLITPAVIDLPTVEKAGQPRVVPLEVYVKSDRGLVVRARDAAGVIVSERTVSRGELASAIKEVRGKNAELSALVGGDKDARYEAVLQVMDELRKQGVTKVGLQVKLAQWPRRRWRMGCMAAGRGRRWAAPRRSRRSCTSCWSACCFSACVSRTRRRRP